LHSFPSIIGNIFEFNHFIHDFIMKRIDVLEDHSNSNQ